MGRRYYCEFCDKSFADNPTNKKNHLKGVFHQRMRKQHYDAFREPEAILAEESLKSVCRRFETTGNCDYGDGCRYSHLTAERRQQLESQIHKKKDEGIKKQQAEEKEIHLKDWLAKRAKMSVAASSDVTMDPEPECEELPVYKLPACLVGVPNLPPSLLPPPPWTSKHLSRAEWG